MARSLRRVRWHVLVLAVGVTAPAGGAAQEKGAARTSDRPDSSVVLPLAVLNVTATRGLREVFRTPAAVTVVTRERLDALGAASVADAFRTLPGLDVEGVGPSQHRPVIRGMRGQRIVLLEDGLRLNHPRRRADSGEPTALAGLGALERVEVVRGPASVLYGSDAIGGAINLIRRRPPMGDARVRGTAQAAWSSAGGRSGGSAAIEGAARGFAFRMGAGARRAGDYLAPAGRYGDVTLHRATPVFDSGADEQSVHGELRHAVGAGDAFVRYERYVAENGGFGWMDPAVIGGSPSIVRLRFPRQAWWRTVAGYRGADLQSLLADRLDAVVYVQDNSRDFITEVHSPTPTGAVDTRSVNFTGLETAGVRIEAARLIRDRVLFTYGIEVVRSASLNTDTSTTTIVSNGQSTVTARGGSSVPDARLLDVGTFMQSEITLRRRLDLILGVRYQMNRAEGLETRGYPDPLTRTTDGAWVGAAHALLRINDDVTVIGSASRGFRAPNLLERFFAGNTPEGRGFWLRNEALGPERSLNLEIGSRLRTGRFHAETFLFQNTLADGIVLEPTGQVTGRRTVYRNVNVDRLRFRGWELAAGADLVGGLRVDGDFVVLDVDDLRDPARVFAETYPSRLSARMRYDSPGNRLWLEYGVRRNGGNDGPLPDATVVGPTLPAFTVHGVRAGLRAHERVQLTASIENLTDRLYAEPLNVGVFRPEPARSLELRAHVSF